MVENKILVIRGGAIGDFVLTLPVLAALRAQFPETRLEVLGYPHIAQLALAGGLADAMRSIEARALAGFFAQDGDLSPELRDYFSGFAIILSYLYDPDGIFQGNVARCSQARFIQGPHRPDDQAGVHAARVLLKPLESLAIFDPDPVPKLKVATLPEGARPGRFSPQTLAAPTAGTKRDRSAVGATGACGCAAVGDRPRPGEKCEPAGTTMLALHPGSGSERKNWPEQNWRDLLAELGQVPGCQFLLVGGEAEGLRLDRLASSLPPSRLQMARSIALADLAARLTGCDAFVGHDSGISHLAAALGVPSLILWNDTVEAVWRPQGSHVSLLRDPGGLSRLTVRVVKDRLTALLAGCG